jgi:hypothetical protein
LIAIKLKIIIKLTKIIIIMKKWVVKLHESSLGKDSNERDFKIEFYDFIEIVNQIFEINDEIIEEILLLTEKYDYFNIMHNIRSVKSYEGHLEELDYSNREILVLLGTNILDQRFGFLFLKDMKNSYRILGIWPQKFLEQISENNKLILDYLSDIIHNSNSFIDISIILKNKGEI